MPERAVPDQTFYTYRSPVGRLSIAATSEGICALTFGEACLIGRKQASELTNRAATQIQEYLAGRRERFDIPLAPQGSVFQLRVWKAICEVPYGCTQTYTELACAIGAAQAARAVGRACNRNPIPILIPSHRIVGANGRPTGNGDELKTKCFLLSLERAENTAPQLTPGRAFPSGVCACGREASMQQ